MARIHRITKKGLNDPDNYDGVCGHSPRARQPEVWS